MQKRSAARTSLGLPSLAFDMGCALGGEDDGAASPGEGSWSHAHRDGSYLKQEEFHVLHGLSASQRLYKRLVLLQHHFFPYLRQAQFARLSHCVRPFYLQDFENTVRPNRAPWLGWPQYPVAGRYFETFVSACGLSVGYHFGYHSKTAEAKPRYRHGPTTIPQGNGARIDAVVR